MKFDELYKKVIDSCKAFEERQVPIHLDFKIEDLREALIESNETIEKLVGAKKSAEQILQNLLDCGLIKEWYFNGKFNAVLKADDPHLQIAELKIWERCKESEADAAETLALLEERKRKREERRYIMAQELKHHHINELIGMTKLKGCIGSPIVYYANEVDAVVAKKDTKIQTLKEKLMAYGNTNAFLAKENTDLKIITESKDAEIRRLKRALWLMTAEWAECMGLASFNIARKLSVKERFFYHDEADRKKDIKKYKHRQVVFYKYADYCRAKADEYK